MIALLLALAAAEPPPLAEMAGVVHLRVAREATAPPLARLYAWLGLTGPGRGGVHTATGAGVVVGDPPGIVTCLHVVSGARRLEVEGPDGRSLGVVDPHTVWVHPQVDLARVALPAGWSAAPRALTDHTPDHLRLVGFPGDRELEARAGAVVGREPHTVPGQAAQELLRVAAPVAPGMSGGPALDATGRVVGIVQAGSEADSALGGDTLVLPAARVLELLEAAPVRPGSGPATFAPEGEAVRVVDPGGAAWLGLAAGDLLEGGDRTGRVAWRTDGVAVLVR